MKRSVSHWMMLLAALVGLPRAVAGDDPQLTRYFSGLRERGLFVVAEDYAVSQLSPADSAPRRYVQLVIELSETLAVHAELQPGPQQAELMQSARRYLDEAQQATERTPEERFRLTSERALLDVRHAALLQWETELSDDPAWRQLCRQLAEQGVLLTRQLVSQLPEPTSEFTRSQREQLEDRLLLGTGTALLTLARTNESIVDRTGFLVSATQLYEENLKRRGRSELVRESKLGLVQVARMQRDIPQATTILKSLLTLAVPVEFRDRILAERVRLLLDESKFDVGLEQLTTELRGRGDIPPELHALTVAVLAGASNIAAQRGQPQLQADLLLQAEQELTATYGRWHRWGHHQLQRARNARQYGPQLAPLVEQGTAAFAQGDLVSAAELFQEATRVAHQENRTDLAVEFALTRGSIFLKRQDYAAAATTFRQLYDAYPRHARASEAHLLLCFAVGQLHAVQPNAERLAAYESALKEHQRQFAHVDSGSEASWLLAELYAGRLDWLQANASLSAIPVGHPRHDAARLQRVRNDLQHLNSIPLNSEPFQTQWMEAISQLGQIVGEYPQAPAIWSVLQAETALVGSQLLLLGANARYADADGLLSRILESARNAARDAQLQQTAVEPAWESIIRRARQLRIVSLAGQGNIAAARDSLDQLEATEPAALLAILNGLAELTDALPESQRKQLGRLQQETATALQQRRSELPAQQQAELDEVIAQSHISSGDLIEAAHIYERLLNDQPTDQRLIRKIAELYFEHAAPADLTMAQSRWTQLEQLNAPGSVPWLTARLEVIRTMQRAGDVMAAKKLHGVTRILYPKLGTPDLKERYESMQFD